VIKWSYSGLKDFTKCPRQYHEVKVLQNFKKEVTEQMRYGTEVHQALEDYVRNGIPLNRNYERFQPLLDVLMRMSGTRFPEHKMALTIDKQPCGFDDADYWVRGIADLLIIDGDHAFVIDYKTGKPKMPDPDQLKLMALMVFAHFPSVKKIKAALAFILYDVFIPEEYERNQVDSIWDVFNPDLMRLSLAYENNTWMPNPTPLCGWCPVDTCEFYKRRRN
jgi:hypothetical protein